jgi:crotonobetainyl-CoA:carnitine CoA-transferase CaiB-like acyl-CoA transferase
MLADPRFATPRARAENREAVIDALSALTAGFTKAQLKERLGGVVPFGPVMDIAAIAADPHFAARGMLARVDIEGFPEPMRVAGPPIKLTRTPSGVRRRAPNLGEDTAAVLSEHGVGEDEAERWHTSGAIREAKPREAKQ